MTEQWALHRASEPGAVAPPCLELGAYVESLDVCRSQLPFARVEGLRVAREATDRRHGSVARNPAAFSYCNSPALSLLKVDFNKRLDQLLSFPYLRRPDPKLPRAASKTFTELLAFGTVFLLQRPSPGIRDRSPVLFRELLHMPDVLTPFKAFPTNVVSLLSGFFRQSLDVLVRNKLVLLAVQI